MSYEKIKEAVIKQLKCDDVQQTFKDVVNGGASGGLVVSSTIMKLSNLPRITWITSINI